MSDLTAERFGALLASYGAAIERWPEADRAAALAHLHADPGAAEAFAREAVLDDLLASSVTPAPSPALTRSVLAGAPQRRSRRRLLTWWTGLALAGAGTAGVIFGTAAATAFEPASNIPSYSHAGATAFGAIDGDPEDI